MQLHGGESKNQLNDSMAKKHGTVLVAAALVAAMLAEMSVAAATRMRRPNTEHGHEMPHAPRHDCVDDAMKLCVPHKGASLTENVIISRFYSCLAKKRPQLPATCHHVVDNLAPCVEDIQKHCSGMTMAPTVECIDEHRDVISAACKQSHWFSLHHPQDHERQSKIPEHHDDPEHDEEDHLLHPLRRKARAPKQHVLPHESDDFGEEDL